MSDRAGIVKLKLGGRLGMASMHAWGWRRDARMRKGMRNKDTTL
jgi:hypothetical protein